MEILVSKNEVMTLDTYLDEETSPWWSYVIGFPNMIIGGIKSLFAEEDEPVSSDKTGLGTIELSKKELKKIETLKKMITAYVDKKTSMTSVTATFQNPKVAAVVADSVVKKLQEYIIDYRTFKAKEDCLYLEKLLKNGGRNIMPPSRNMPIIWIPMIISFCRVFVPNRSVCRMM